MAEAEWYKNPYAWLGAAAGAAIAIPAGIALAPPVMAGLGVIGGAAALTALGAGVIATTFAIGKHIDEAKEANNSHDTIKKILDKTEKDYTDDKKINDIERIVKAKTNNIFLKLFDHQSSQEIDDLYLGALNPEGVAEKDKAKKIIEGLKVVNKLDQLKSTNDEEFLEDLKNFKNTKGLSFAPAPAGGVPGDDAAAAAADARKAKIRQDFENSTNALSTIYQYKLFSYK